MTLGVAGIVTADKGMAYIVMVVGYTPIYTRGAPGSRLTAATSISALALSPLSATATCFMFALIPRPAIYTKRRTAKGRWTCSRSSRVPNIRLKPAEEATWAIMAFKGSLIANGSR